MPWLERTGRVLKQPLGGEFVGYGCVSWRSEYPLFRDASIPEIQDLNVLPDHRRQGVGTALLDALERVIAARSPLAGLGVGVYSDYGSAMRLYIARGYQFDGRGLMSAGRPVVPGSLVRIDDDDATLMLSKNLTREPAKARVGIGLPCEPQGCGGGTVAVLPRT